MCADEQPGVAAGHVVRLGLLLGWDDIIIGWNY
jgi:hypothetical protein